MQKYFEVLRKCPLFDGFTDFDLGSMLGCFGAQVVSYNKKQTVFSEGDPVRWIGILLSGSVQITQIDYFGNRSIVATLGPSELFAESFACAGVGEMPVSVVAGERSEILLIEHTRIMHPCSNVCEFHQRIIENLLRIVATKNLQFHQKIQIASKRTTREKLMAYLMLQAKKYDSNKFIIPYDRQELADFLGVDRSGLSVEISKLRSERILKSDRSEFELLNPVEE